MIRHKQQPVEHITPLRLSADWIAHNASMAAKRELLAGVRYKPVIGLTYSPRMHVAPAVSTHWANHPLRRIDKLKSLACMAALIAFMAVVMFTGPGAGFW